MRIYSGWSNNIFVIPWWTEVKFCHHMALSSSPARQNKGPVTKTWHFKGGHDGQAEIDLSSVTWGGGEAVNSPCFLIYSRGLS